MRRLGPLRHALWLGPFICLSCGGASVTTVPLVSAAGAPITLTPTGAIPLEVTTHSAAVPDPLPVRHSTIAYSQVESALGHAVSSAAVPWAEAHRDKRPDGWQLQVELISASVEQREARLIVMLSVRATLRTRVGNVYLAQTHAHCVQAGLVEAKDGASVMYACMNHIGRDLAGWLGGVEP